MKKTDALSLAVVLAFIGFLIFIGYAAQAQACGTERWEAKVMTSTLSQFVGTVMNEQADGGHAPVHIRVNELTYLEAPPYDEARDRTIGPEQTIYEIDAYVLGYKLEGDGDYHVVISDCPKGCPTMVIEFADPKCSADPRIFSSRVDFHHLAGRIVPKYRKLVKPLYLRFVGPGFFDKIHGQTGVAPNGIEIHPVLSVAS